MRFKIIDFTTNLCAAILGFALFCSAAVAQTAEPPSKAPLAAPEAADEAAPESIFPHAAEGRFWLSGQMNFIYQTNPPFDAKYSGANSMKPNYEKAISRVLSLYAGVQITPSTEALVTLEETGGSGLSDALGLAGFSNLDVVRNPTLSKSPYLARVIFHQVIALSDKKTEAGRGPLSTFSALPERRLEIRAGKFSTADFFDVNSVGSDSHLQFMNWSTTQNGAYDYAADTRGYTWGALLEYQQKSFGFRFGEMLMPTVANGIHLVWNLRQAHADNFELELHRGLLPKRAGTIRVLSFVNHANMGIYREAVAQFEAGVTPVPDITAHPRNTTIKYGFGVGLEQALSADWKAFARWGWNNGKTESYVYTEIDSTISLGLGVNGRQWGRKQDRAGAAFSSNAISRDHQAYLAYGGLGFIIGDGALNYGRETVFEAYYNAHLWRGIYLGPDLQHVNNPAYNRDRGPVIIPGFRIHVEL